MVATRRRFALRPVVALAFAGTLCGCASSVRGAAERTPPSGRASRSQGPAVVALEQQVHEAVNAHRRARGLPILEFEARIARQARLHSDAMATGTIPLGHDGFAARVEALRQAMPCRRTAENVAFNRGHSDPGAEAVRGWIASRSHRRNIEGPYELTGVGIARNARGEIYFTQLFVGQ